MAEKNQAQNKTALMPVTKRNLLSGAAGRAELAALVALFLSMPLSLGVTSIQRAWADSAVDKAIIQAYKLRHAHQPNRALDILNEVAAKATKNGAFFAERAADYIDLKDLTSARKDCETAIKLDPKLSDAYDRRAYCHAVANELDLAIADYSTAIKLNPKSAMPYHNRAIAYRSQGKLAEAKADMTKYLSLKPGREAQKEHENLVQRAEILEQNGNVHQAMTYLESQIKFAPSATLYLHLGNLQAKTGRHKEALQSYAQAVELGKKESGPPAGRMALLSSASLLAEDKNYAEAITAATKVIGQTKAVETVGAYKTESKNEHSRALLLRASCYNNLKQYDKAMTDLNQALAIAPDTTAAIKLRADIYMAQGKNLEKAVQDYSTVIKRNSGELKAQLSRAECYGRLKQYKHAVDDYTAIIERAPSSAREAYEGRAKIYKDMNEPAKAQADLDRAGQTKAD